MKVKKNSLSVYYDNQDMDKTTIDQIKTKFEEFDLDGNGKLDEYELTKLFEKLGSPKYVILGLEISHIDRQENSCKQFSSPVFIFLNFNLPDFFIGFYCAFKGIVWISDDCHWKILVVAEWGATCLTFYSKAQRVHGVTLIFV